MPIAVGANTAYGPPLVNQKYRPLEQVDYQTNDVGIYSGLLTNRRQLLANRAIGPNGLALAVSDWPTVVNAEANHLPPLVVISSNRSKWIAQGIANGNAKAQKRPLNRFDGVTDLNALDLDELKLKDDKKVSPPFYAPVRLGNAPNRNVYVVVHMLEYRTYRNALDQHNITTVGFDFGSPAGTGISVAGFGASRYAAIAFCTALRAQVLAAPAAAWDYAWLIDDNVVALTSFPGLAAVENAMAAAAAPQIAAGFKGGTSAEAFSANGNWARREIQAGRDGVGAHIPGLPRVDPPGILQQAVLWNIQYMSANSLNFGLGYVESGEDVSFGNYCQTQNPPVPYLWYGGIGVRKEVTSYDNSNGYRRFSGMRGSLTQAVVAAERRVPAAPAPPPPPPVQVQPRAGGAPMTVQDFVIDKVLPNCPWGAGNARFDGNVRARACCQAVELMTLEAMAEGLNYVNAAARTATFSTAGVNAIAVNRRSVP